MRIIAGKYGGRRLAPVRGEVRPTSDRLRETLFNILQGSIQDSVWLDGFAGSGAVGIEALSRGARYVIFNEKSPVALRLLRRNLEICGVTDGFEVHQRDILTLLATLRSDPVDFLFLDPPYDYPRYDKLLRKIVGCPLLHQRTLVILELFKKTRLEFPPDWTIQRIQREGDSQLIFLLVNRQEAPNSPAQIQNT